MSRKYIDTEVVKTIRTPDKIICDVCGKEIVTREKPKSEYWELGTQHHDWDSDSCESYEHYDLCSVECVRKKFEDYLKDCENSCTQEFELKQNMTYFSRGELIY